MIADSVAKELFRLITAQREEILRAFVAKHGIADPADAIIVEQHTLNGKKWMVRLASPEEKALFAAKPAPPPEPAEVWVGRGEYGWRTIYDARPEPKASAVRYVRADSMVTPEDSDRKLGAELRTHLGDIREAFQIAERHAAPPDRETNSDDAAYWRHQLKALDTAMRRAGIAP